MNTLKLIIGVVVALFFSSCSVMLEQPVAADGSGSSSSNDRSAYVDTYVPISASLARLIAASVDGYSSPSISSYGEYLYPSDAAYDADNLPCYVKSDFNNDGFDDYAFLFSKVEETSSQWYLTTKLVVVLSTSYGMELATDMTLGTVNADLSTPIEEYWALALVPAGTHTMESWKSGVKVTQTITLDNDGVFLASLDPNEEKLLYASGSSMYETGWFDSGFGKKQIQHSSGTAKVRAIPFMKNIEGRKSVRG